jgi:hypothetical protein
MSDSRYTNDVIGVRWLKHFIKHTNSGPIAPKKLLLYDGHGSHDTEEFKELAVQNNIILYMFPPHLTYIMQPLDVGYFQSYKHWHNLAIHQAIRNLEDVYDYACFLRDLPEFRKKTFTESTIVHSFIKSGLFPIDASIVLDKMKKYSNPELEPNLLVVYNNIYSTPKTISHSLQLGEALSKKIEPLLSSPTRNHFRSLNKGNEQMFQVLHIEQNDLI